MLYSNPILSYEVVRDEKTLLPQRMCTYAAGKGREKSRRLIRVSASGYVMVNIQLVIPINWKLSNAYLSVYLFNKGRFVLNIFLNVFWIEHRAFFFDSTVFTHCF